MKASSSGVALAAAKIEVALVLAVLVVDHDDRPPGRDVGDRALDRVEPHRAVPSCRLTLAPRRWPASPSGSLLGVRSASQVTKPQITNTP